MHGLVHAQSKTDHGEQRGTEHSHKAEAATPYVLMVLRSTVGGESVPSHCFETELAESATKRLSCPAIYTQHTTIKNSKRQQAGQDSKSYDVEARGS
jgi:hypothetical protein